MSTVNEKYIKDESGNTISPITSSNSIYLENNNTSKLSDNYVVKKKDLMTSAITVESGKTTTITLKDKASNYDIVLWRIVNTYNPIYGQATSFVIEGTVCPNSTTTRHWTIQLTTSDHITYTAKTPYFFDFTGGYNQGSGSAVYAAIGIKFLN